MEKTMIRSILARNIILYVIVFLILGRVVNWQECYIKRGKYLLGIVYNGFFQNNHDKIVYEDYIKRHGSTPVIFQQSL